MRTDPLSCPTPLRPCACRQTARFALGMICRRKGNRPDREVDCEEPPSLGWCKTCPLWGGLHGCLAGTKLAEDEDRRVHRPGRLAKIPLEPRRT